MNTPNEEINMKVSIRLDVHRRRRTEETGIDIISKEPIHEELFRGQLSSSVRSLHSLIAKFILMFETSVSLVPSQPLTSSKFSGQPSATFQK